MTNTKGQISKGTTNGNRIQLGANRNRQSKFSSAEAINMIGGFAPVLDKEGKVESYRWNFITKLKIGSKANYRTGFVNVTIEEHQAIYKTLKLTEGDLKEGNEGYMKLVNDKGEAAPKLQSLLDGLKLGDNTFNSKGIEQIRIYADIFAGVENAVFHSTKHDCEMVKNEAVTKFGVRCFTSSEGDLKPLYVENRPFWTTAKDKNGKLVADTTIKEALQMCNDADELGVVWSYSDKDFINPYDLEQFYKDNDIVCTQLSEKIQEGVFSEVAENAFDWENFDVASLSTLADAKTFAVENAEFLGKIDFKGLDLAKSQKAIGKAIAAGLAAIETEE